MSPREWIKSKLGITTGRSSVLGTGAKPLREFVYLDEVSLRSLLSSQTGEVTEGKSEQSTAADQLNADATVGVQAPLFSKAELTSRFQTSNSSTLQTSRKATVQSWFRELHAQTNLRLISPMALVTAPASADDLLAINEISILAPSNALRRGELVEFRVVLGSDPIFHLGTMATEFSGLIEGSPEMFVGNSALGPLKEFQPINKALQRLMAGLIPIRGEAVDHVTVEIEDVAYVVHRDAIRGLGLTERPLEIVGVTEHLAYWKDIRRVLFSRAEFTVLARIARSGLQETWTPVKLGDLFQVVAPDFNEQLNTASRDSLAGTAGGTSVNANELNLVVALEKYASQVLTIGGVKLTCAQSLALDEEIALLGPRAATVTGQRDAFGAVKQLLCAFTGIEVHSADDAALREEARASSGLSLFPSLSSSTITVGGNESENGPVPRLLDVEVVAIYW